MATYSSLREKCSRLSRQYFSAVSRLSGNILSIISHLQPPPPSTLGLISILSLLTALAQLQFNGKQNSPFEIHPICMTIAVVSLILYLILREASHWLPLNSNSDESRLNLVSNIFAAILRNTALICLATILLPDNIKPYLYVSCAFILTAVTVHSIFKLLRCPPKTVWRRMIEVAASPSAWLIWGREIFQSRDGGDDGLPLLRRPPEQQTTLWRRMIEVAASPSAWLIWGREIFQSRDGGDDGLPLVHRPRNNRRLFGEE